MSPLFCTSGFGCNSFPAVGGKHPVVVAVSSFTDIGGDFLLLLVFALLLMTILLMLSSLLLVAWDT
jgi:hypothetical protein